MGSVPYRWEFRDTFMSDSDESTVTYTEVSSPFEGLSDIRSPGVVFLAERQQQPLPAAASPTTQSPDYVLEFDPEENPVDYPADGGDDGDDEDESSEDDKDEEVDIEADDEEEEEYPAPADSTAVALPAIDQAPSAEETELFETDESAATPPPHLAYRVTTRISIPAPVPTPAWSDSEVVKLLTISTSPSSPLSPYPIRSLGYRAAMIWLRAAAASASHSLPLPPPFILSHTRPAAPLSGTPPLRLLSTDRREDIPEVTLPPRKRLGIVLGPAYEVKKSSSAAARPTGGLRADYGFVAMMDREIRRDPEREVGYGITDSWDEIVETLQGAPVSANTELGRHMTAFETRVRQDTNEIYTRLDDEQKARLSREAWRQSMDASDLAHEWFVTDVLTGFNGSDVRGKGGDLREEILKADHRSSAEIRELRTADHTRQQQLIQTLIVMQGQQGPAGGPAQPELPEEVNYLKEQTLCKLKVKIYLIKRSNKWYQKELLKLDEELAFKLQAEEYEEEKLAREKAQKVKEANIAWDDIQAKVEADYQLA
ncbi:hypothetical protein Tco_1002361 [Tanacetum coccineum]|uniref:Uncharacterized protein n=1 Tax=Tanacetum coccineum TaxID=301880 RepID=A0ABQ5F633_9ASTR